MSQLIYFAGQDVGLTATPEATGTLTVTLSVTDPAGVVSTPTTAAQGAGVYGAVVPSVSVPGVWLYRWLSVSSTGARWVSEGQFQVQATSVEQVVDLASVKAYLNVPAADTTKDDELRGFILAASEQARDVCGPMLPEQHTQFFDGGLTTVVPDWRPLASVQSVTEYYGLYGYVLTEQPLGGQTNAYGFTVDLVTGQITRRTMGGAAAPYAYGQKNVKVVYTAGTAGIIPYTVRLGALELIRHLWQLTQQGGRPRFGGSALDGETAGVPTGFALPARVLELWQPKKRAPGIA